MRGGHQISTRIGLVHRNFTLCEDGTLKKEPKNELDGMETVVRTVTSREWSEHWLFMHGGKK